MMRMTLDLSTRRRPLAIGFPPAFEYRDGAITIKTVDR